MRFVFNGGKLTKASQLYNLICIRERKEGQIRSLRWMRTVVQGNLIRRDGDYAELKKMDNILAAQLNREHRELDKIWEDIRELKSELKPTSENIEHLAMIFVQ